MNVVIFGTNETALLAQYYLDKDSAFTPIAFCIDSEYIKTRTENGLPVLAIEEVDKSCSFFVPLYDNRLREKKANEIKEKGYNLISYISSKATIWTQNIGTNCFIMENNVIQPYVKIGNNVIMWSGNHIGHHTTIGDNVFFSSHVVLSGKCIVEDYSWFGVKSPLSPYRYAFIEEIKISTGTVVGMGSVVLHDTVENMTYIGNPAKEHCK